MADEKKETKEQEEQGQKKKLRVMIVDDDKSFTNGFQKLVEDEGFEVVVEHNGKEAFHTFESRGFDAIFIDGLIPGMDGFSLASEIRWVRHGEQVPIVIVSGVYRAANHAEQATKKYRLADYLEKPVTPEAIIECLRDIFGNEYPKQEVEKSLGKEKQEKKNKPYSMTFINKHFLYDQTKISLIGKTKDTPFSILLHQIYERKLSGMIGLEQERAKKIITVHKGIPISVSSNIVGECLGRMMFRQGLITKEDLEASLQKLKEEGVKQGQALVEMGVIPPQKLEEYLKKQLEYKITSAFAWTTASFTFKPTDEIPPPPTKTDTHPYRLIRRGVEKYFKPENLQTWLHPYQSSPVVVNKDCFDRMQKAGYKSQDISLIKELGAKPPTIEEIIKNHGGQNVDMTAFLFSLISISAIRLKQPTRMEKPLNAKGIGEKESAFSKHIKHHLDNNKEELEKNLNEEEKAELEAALEKMNLEQQAYYKELIEYRTKLKTLDYFQILEIDRKAPPENVKRSYFKKAKEYHPDAVRFQDVPEIRMIADQIFAVLGKAHETLVHEDQKKEYIDILEGGGNVDASEEVARILAGEKYFHQGMIAVKRKDWQKAKENFEEAIKMSPTEGEFHIELGWAKFNMAGDNKLIRNEAKQHIDKGLGHSPKIANGHYYLGVIQKSSDMPGKAVEEFKKAIELNPRHQRAKSELNLMKMRMQGQKGGEDKPKEKKSLFSKFIKK